MEDEKTTANHGKERLGAFIDAVLAIVMTILVLELEKPKTFDLQGLWELRTNFLAYGISFFWLGAMWVNLHSSSHLVKKISQKTVWVAIVMLFFSSLFSLCDTAHSDSFYEWGHADLLRNHRPTHHFFSLMVLPDAGGGE